MGTSDGRSRQGPPSPASGRPHVDRQPLSPPAASAPRQLRRHNCRGPKGKPNAGASDGRTGHRANTRVASRRQGAGRASDNARTTASFPVMRQPSKHRGSGGCPSERWLPPPDRRPRTNCEGCGGVLVARPAAAQAHPPWAPLWSPWSAGRPRCIPHGMANQRQRVAGDRVEWNSSGPRFVAGFPWPGESAAVKLRR